MLKKFFLTLVLSLFAFVSLTSCGKNNNDSSMKTFDFVICEKDTDQDPSNNPVVVKYTIETTAEYVSDALIAKDNNRYYFSESSDDYIVMANGDYGLYYTMGYFKNFSGCADNTEYDISWSMTLGNGESLMTGISSTPTEGLTEYKLIIDGFR